MWNPAIERTRSGLYRTALDGVNAFDEDRDALYGTGIAILLNSHWRPVYGHPGWIPDYSSSLQYYLERDTAIAFQTNTYIGIIDRGAPILLQLENEIGCVVLGVPVVNIPRRIFYC